jgi:hypothetical protein
MTPIRTFKDTHYSLQNQPTSAYGNKKIARPAGRILAIHHQLNYSFPLLLLLYHSSGSAPQPATTHQSDKKPPRAHLSINLHTQQQSQERKNFTNEISPIRRKHDSKQEIIPGAFYFT